MTNSNRSGAAQDAMETFIQNRIEQAAESLVFLGVVGDAHKVLTSGAGLAAFHALVHVSRDAAFGRFKAAFDHLSYDERRDIGGRLAQVDFNLIHIPFGDNVPTLLRAVKRAEAMAGDVSVIAVRSMDEVIEAARTRDTMKTMARLAPLPAATKA